MLINVSKKHKCANKDEIAKVTRAKLMNMQQWISGQQFNEQHARYLDPCPYKHYP